MSKVRVKICGITNIEDAMTALQCGADAIGFVFAESPRKVSPTRVREITRQLPPLIQKIGVFVDTDPETINDICDFCFLDWAQLHGSESPEILKLVKRPVIKGIRLKDQGSFPMLSKYSDFFVLIDSYHPEKMGGTGELANWDLAVRVAEVRPIILAGGLTPENAREAITAVKPYAVDVSSGVERSPGKKDPYLVEKFIKIVKEF